MASPFPGMDPWLESPALWPDVHHRVIVYACESLQPQVGQDHVVAIGERVYLEHAAGAGYYPDVSVARKERGVRDGSPQGGESGVAAPIVVDLSEVERREPYLEVVEAASGGRVVTVVELLSPSNKRPGGGRESYLAKQSEVLGSPAHLVEVDLLRGGSPTVAVPEDLLPPSTYRAVVSPASARLRREVFPIALREPLPRLPIPWAAGRPPLVLDLQAALDRSYAAGAFDRRVDRTRPPPPPPLSAADAAWVSRLLAG